MKMRFAACAAALVLPAAAQAADYVTLHLQTDVGASAEKTWKAVGPFCAIGSMLKLDCVISQGRDGEVGAVRVLGGGRFEVGQQVRPQARQNRGRQCLNETLQCRRSVN